MMDSIINFYHDIFSIMLIIGDIVLYLICQIVFKFFSKNKKFELYFLIFFAILLSFFLLWFFVFSKPENFYFAGSCGFKAFIITLKKYLIFFKDKDWFFFWLIFVFYVLWSIYKDCKAKIPLNQKETLWKFFKAFRFRGYFRYF